MATLDELIAAMNRMAAEQAKTNRILSEVVNNTRNDGSPTSPTITMSASEAAASDPMDSASIELLKEQLQNESAILRSKQIELNQAILDKDEQKILALRAQIREHQKIQYQSQRTLQNYKDMEGFGKDFANSIADSAKGMMSGNLNLQSIRGTIKGLTEKGKDLISLSNLEEFDFADLSAKFKDMKNGIAQVVIDLNLEFYQKILDLAIEIEKLEIEVRKATGASKEFAKDMRDLRNEVIMTGASIQDLGKSQIALAKGFTDFTMTGKESRQELLKVTTVLDRLGFPAETSAKAIQDLTKGLGMSTSAAGAMLIEFEALGKDIGVSAGQMAQDYEKVSNNILKLGEQGPQAFKDLAAAAKITGLEIQKITGMTDKFDTFDGAAEQVGKLNAALGGNFVNAMDLMMTADPTERFEMIRDSILDAGLSFEEMSYYQKNFYADALGLSDVSELSKALSGDMDSLNGSMGQTSAELEDAEERAKSLQTFQESLQNLFASFVPVLSPVIDMLQDLATFLQKNAETVKKVIGVLLVLGGVITVIASGGATLPIVAGALTSLSGGLISFGDAGNDSIGKFIDSFGRLKDTLGPLGKMVSDSFGRLKDSLVASWKAAEPFRKALFIIAELLLTVVGAALIVLTSLFFDLVAIMVDVASFFNKIFNLFSGVGVLINSIVIAYQLLTDENYSLLDGFRDFVAGFIVLFEPVLFILDTMFNTLLGIINLIPGVELESNLAGSVSGFAKDTVASGKSEGLGLTPMAEGGIVKGPTPALVGEAGPEAIIPLDQLASVAMSIIAAPMAGPAKMVESVISSVTNTTNENNTNKEVSQIVVNLTLDGKVIDKKIIDVVNKKALDSLVGL